MSPMCFLMYISIDGPTGLFNIVFHQLCFQLASLVGVPTPPEINGAVPWLDTSISSAAHNAVVSSTLLIKD